MTDPKRSFVALEEMEKLKASKSVRYQHHSRLPLTIYNYSQSVQYKKRWNEMLMRCRVLVIDDNTGQIVASPMPKFFNYDETRHESLSMDECDVVEKLDGSLGIYFKYGDEWVFASRGSFISAQAKKGEEMAKEKELNKLCDPEYTYMFEIIYPGNRIVSSLPSLAAHPCRLSL